MGRKTRIISSLVIVFQLLFPATSLATSNIQYINPDTTASELIVQQNGKAMLEKEWYTYKFEVDKQAAKQLYPVDMAEYQKALEEVEYPLDNIGDYKVYFMNYKLENYSAALALSFLDDSCVVFGSYSKLSQVKVDQIAVHELGHQIDFSLMNEDTWRQYTELRGLSDTVKYNNWSTNHYDRPQEIFAEDFRLLFGGEGAKTLGHLNRDLSDPNSVSGLKEFYLSLNDQAV